MADWSAKTSVGLVLSQIGQSGADRDRTFHRGAGAKTQFFGAIEQLSTRKWL